MYEHRNIVEKAIGHKLGSNIVINHLNGNKLDNRISNLKTMRLPEHSRMHYNNGDIHRLTKAEMRQGAITTNKILKKKRSR